MNCVLRIAAFPRCFSADLRLGRLAFRPADHAEIELAAVDVDPGDRHPQQVAEPIRVARAEPGERVGRAIELVVVVGQGIDVDEPSAGNSTPWANSP